MGKKRTASESRHGAEKPFQKHDKAHNRSKENRHGARDPKPAPAGKKSSLTFEPRPDWHAAELPPISIPDDFNPPPRYVLDGVQQYAVSLLESENKTYADSNMSADSSHKFLNTIMASGTLEDKVSALTLLIQESPLHTMKAFENLLGLGKKKSRNQALLALGALKDLLGQGVVLPPDRKLRSFIKQPAVLAAFSGPNANWEEGQRLPPGIENVHLISWAYEDWLKRTYFEMLRILEGWCNDEVEYSRSRAITFVYELLKEKPEQEENLLRLLINKLGDNEKKISSRASYLLLQLQNSHPVMKGIIINAIESECLFRPNQSPHAKYYAIITLNQTILSAKDPDVASKLLEIYFALFLSLLKHGQKSEVKENKLQGGGGQAGKKAKQKAKAKEKEQEKVINAESELNEKLIAGVLTGVNRAFPYAKTDDVAFEKQLDTIFRVTHSSNFNTAIQALLLIQQISAAKHYSTDRFYRTLYESVLDPRLLHSSKQVMYLNLLYRSLKADVSIKRVKAFVKRLLQVITLHEPPFVCGVLYLIYELTKTFPSIKTMLETPELDDEDEEEHFVDAPEEGGAADDSTTTAFATKPSPSSTGPHYDGRKRDPDHAHADLSCLWDLTPLRLHFHPSVSLFASRLLYHSSSSSGAGDDYMPPKPDPTLHSLAHFLDRFAYRNARQQNQQKGEHGVSIMQPMAGSAAKAADLLVRAGGDAARAEAPLNSEAFWRKRVEDVPADEVFFHRYFEKSGARSKKGKGGKNKQAVEKDGDGSDGEDAEEQEIWKALVGSRPDVAGPEDEDDEDLEELGELMGMGESDDEEEEEDEDEDESDGDGDVVIADGPDEEEDEDDEEMVDAQVVEEPRTKKDEKKPKAAAKDEAEDNEGSDVGGFDFDDGDEGAFVGSDEELELPSDFDWEDEEDEEEEVREEKPKKGKKGKKGSEKKAAAAAAAAAPAAEEAGDEGDKDKRGKKRRKLKHLPTFASAEDYAKLLGDDSDGY
ncbi:ccaat-box-binding transcription factor [Diplodia corticola]|uniref:Ccaat-box-binding transcription factor n=1 Tax=Diplodia corticola TaxID=236234 RepID=A0A1J9SGD3_9PEZI|nr:ccaat-box-binding transcription factor [Diplodia corticola]OJD38645.1 ccaat-box-binding transcription factor [Diplodia corticola]